MVIPSYQTLPSIRRSKNELLFVIVAIRLERCGFYKHLKYMTYGKLNQAYYQFDHLWTGSKTIKELHKITSITKKDVWT